MDNCIFDLKSSSNHIDIIENLNYIIEITKNFKKIKMIGLSLNKIVNEEYINIVSKNQTVKISIVFQGSELFSPSCKLFEEIINLDIVIYFNMSNGTIGWCRLCETDVLLQLGRGEDLISLMLITLIDKLDLGFLSVVIHYFSK
jgi:hypothetical protein